MSVSAGGGYVLIKIPDMKYKSANNEDYRSLITQNDYCYSKTKRKQCLYEFSSWIEVVGILMQRTSHALLWEKGK